MPDTPVGKTQSLKPPTQTSGTTCYQASVKGQTVACPAQRSASKRTDKAFLPTQDDSRTRQLDGFLTSQLEKPSLCSHLSTKTSSGVVSAHPRWPAEDRLGLCRIDRLLLDNLATLPIRRCCCCEREPLTQISMSCGHDCSALHYF